MLRITGALLTAVVVSSSLPARAAEECPASKGSMAALNKTAKALQEDRRAICARAGQTPLAQAQVDQIKGCLTTHVEPCASKKTPELFTLVQGPLSPLLTPATFCDEAAWLDAVATARKDYEGNKAKLSKQTNQNLGLLNTKLAQFQTCVHTLATP